MARKKIKITCDTNSSPVGWYIGSIVQQFEELTGPRSRTRKRTLVWENTILIKAKTLKQAYTKLVAEGKLQAVPYENTDGIRVRLKFAGIGFLLPIYDELEDLSEVIWMDHGNISETRARKLIKTKQELLARRTAG